MQRASADSAQALLLGVGRSTAHHLGFRALTSVGIKNSMTQKERKLSSLVPACWAEIASFYAASTSGVPGLHCLQCKKWFLGLNEAEAGYTQKNVLKADDFPGSNSLD